MQVYGPYETSMMLQWSKAVSATFFLFYLIQMLSFTVELLYNSNLRTEFSGRCKEVAVTGKFSIRGLSEWIRSRDRKTGPWKRGDGCAEVAVSGGSTVYVTSVMHN